MTTVVTTKADALLSINQPRTKALEGDLGSYLRGPLDV